jgi:hypothetical protein
VRKEASNKKEQPNPDTGIDQNASRLRSACTAARQDSLKCLAQNTTGCEPFFDAYKACKKAEHEALLEARRAKFT